MTSQPHDQSEDAAFEEFLEGRGELVKQLKALSQLSPSAALDAAILASAKAAVAQAERSKQAAANDPVSPGKSGFFTRFRMPLAMAASLMVAVLVAVQWHAQSDYPAESEAPVQVAQAPAAESSAAPAPAAPAAEVAQADTNAKAAPSATAPVAAARPSGSVTESKAIAIDKKAATPVQAQAQAAANAMAAQDALKSAKERSDTPTQVAQADATQMRSKSAAVQEQGAAPSVTAIAPAAPPAAAPPPPMSPAAANLAKEPARAAVATPADPQEKQKAWLARIEEMARTDSRKEEALAEWAKFEKTYPDYPVPEKLKAQLKALKN